MTVTGGKKGRNWRVVGGGMMGHYQALLGIYRSRPLIQTAGAAA